MSGCFYHGCNARAVNKLTFHSGMSDRYCETHTALFVASEIVDQVTPIEKPYTCWECGLELAFPQAFFVGDITYCGDHLPTYNKDDQW